MKKPYIPEGCDQQGRIEAAHAACEHGMDTPAVRRRKELSPAIGMVVWCFGGGLAVWAVLAFGWLLWKALA